jgi:hypothetical protein
VFSESSSNQSFSQEGGGGHHHHLNPPNKNNSNNNSSSPLPFRFPSLPPSSPSSSSSSWRQNPNKTKSIHFDEEEKHDLYKLDFTDKGIKSKSLIL